MLNFLCQVDIFGKEINLQINKYPVYKTPVGGVVTLFIGVLTLVAIWFFGKDIIEKEHPSVITKKLSLPEWPFIRLYNKDFFFGVRVEDNVGGFLTNPKYFEVWFMYEYYTKNMTTKSLDLNKQILTPGVPCNTSNVDNETLVRESLDTFYCFNFDSENITVGGDWPLDNIGYIDYFIKKCDKKTEERYNITCATDKEYTTDNNYGDKFYAGLKYSNYIVNPSSLDKAVNRDFIYTFQSLSRKIRKQNRVFYTTSVLETDKGWLFEEKVYEKYTTVEKNSIDFMDVSSEDNYVFEGPVYLTNLQNYNIRNYPKVQDIAANVGGIMSIVFAIFKFVYGFYVDNNYWKYLFETLVHFNEKTEDQADGDEDNANFYPQNMKKVAPMLKTTSERTQMHDNILKSDIDSATGKDIKSLHLRLQGQKDNQDLSSVNRLHIIQNLEATKNENQKIEEESLYNNQEQFSENVDNLPVKNNESKYIQNHNPSMANNEILTLRMNKYNTTNQSEQKITLNNPVIEKNTKTTEELISIYENDSEKNNHGHLKDAIAKKKSKRDVQVPIDISETELFKYLFCRCCSLNKIKNQLIFFAQTKIEENLDLTNLLKALDQVKLLKKVVLNSEQCFMLDNKGRIEVTNQILASKGITKVNEDDPIILEEKFKIKKDNLAKYFKAKKEEENISKLDEYLFLHLAKDTKQYVSKEAGVQDFC